MELLATPPPSLGDADAPELRYSNLLTEMDGLALYLLAIALAPFAEVIEVEACDLDSRSTCDWRRWGPHDRRGPDRDRPRRDRRARGRRTEDRVPAFAMT